MGLKLQVGSQRRPLWSNLVRTDHRPMRRPGLRAAGAGLAVVPVEEEQGKGAHHQEEEHPHAEARIVLDGLGRDRCFPGLRDRIPPPHPMADYPACAYPERAANDDAKPKGRFEPTRRQGGPSLPGRHHPEVLRNLLGTRPRRRALGGEVSSPAGANATANNAVPVTLGLEHPPL